MLLRFRPELLSFLRLDCPELCSSVQTSIQPAKMVVPICSTLCNWRQSLLDKRTEWQNTFWTKSKERKPREDNENLGLMHCVLYRLWQVFSLMGKHATDQQAWTPPTNFLQRTPVMKPSLTFQRSPREKEPRNDWRPSQQYLPFVKVITAVLPRSPTPCRSCSSFTSVCTLWEHPTWNHLGYHSRY